MDMNRFTQKSIEAIQSAQSTAQQYGNSQLEPAHLLFALLSQEDGLIPNLLTKMGVQSGAFRDSVEALLAMQPLFADFKAVKEGNVWCARRSLYQATDRIGSFIEDLRRMLAGEEGELTFLYRIPSAGESAQ